MIVVFATLLMLLVVPALVLLANPHAMRDPRLAALAVAGAARRHRRDRDRQRSRAVEAVRYADEVRVAARRAREAARRWDERWRDAEQDAEMAWHAWQDAERQLARARAAAAFPAPQGSRSPEEYADRERYLRQALRAAVERGDLPAAALAGKKTTGDSGWDPRLHPVEQELVLARAIVAHRHERYRQAVAAEQAAWHDALLAGAARDSLDREAGAAGVHAAELRRHLPRTSGAVTPGRRGLVQRTV